MVKNS